MRARLIIFGMQVDNDELYRGIENQPSPVFFFPVFVQFSFFLYLELWNFSSNISVKLCKLDLSYLVCRLIMMNCIVRLQTSLLMLIHPVFAKFSSFPYID